MQKVVRVSSFGDNSRIFSYSSQNACFYNFMQLIFFSLIPQFSLFTRVFSPDKTNKQTNTLFASMYVEIRKRGRKRDKFRKLKEWRGWGRNAQAIFCFHFYPLSYYIPHPNLPLKLTFSIFIFYVKVKCINS